MVYMTLYGLLFIWKVSNIHKESSTVNPWSPHLASNFPANPFSTLPPGYVVTPDRTIQF